MLELRHLVTVKSVQYLLFGFLVIAKRSVKWGLLGLSTFESIIKTEPESRNTMRNIRMNCSFTPGEKTRIHAHRMVIKLNDAGISDKPYVDI